MNLQLTLAARYLLGRKLRTLLTTIAIIFGVLLIVGMNSVLPTLLAALQANVQGAEGNVDFTITNVSGQSFPEDAAEPLRQMDGVRAVSVSLNRTLNLPADFVDQDASRVDRVLAVNLVGINPEEARSVRAFPVLRGRFLESTDTNAAVISQTLADAFSVDVGDTFVLPAVPGMTRLQVIGILPATISFATEEVWVNLPQAQLMAGEPGRANIISVNGEAFMAQARHAEVQANIETTLGEHYKVGALMGDDEMFASLELGRVALSIFGALALFMGGFIIFNTFRTVVTERRRDIGMLRALGATRRTIMGMVLAEGLLQGLLGSGIGLLLGYLMAVGVLKLAQRPLSQFINLALGAPVLTPGLILVAVLLGVVTTVLAGLLPAWNASRITPLEALRPSLAEVEFKRQSGTGFIAGLVLLALAVAGIGTGQAMVILPGGIVFLVGLVLIAPALVRPFALLLGRPAAFLSRRQGTGSLAQSNLARQPGRVAVTASASMLGLAVIVVAGGLITSMTGTLFDMLRDGLGSDFMLVPPSLGLWSTDVPADPAFAAELRQVEGVEAVSTQRFAASSTGGQAISLLGIVPEDFRAVSGLSFIEGNESVYDSLSTERTMIVNGSFLLATGAHQGDTVELLTADGVVAYRIAAVAADLLNAKITTAYISQDNMLADFGASGDVFIQLDLEEGADPEAAGRQIKSLAANYPQFKVVSGADFFGSMLAVSRAAFTGVYLLFAVLAMPSLIAMLNTLTISVIERRREIGMLRAVGATRKQIRNMVMAEALLLAAIGAIFGILGGIYLGYVIVTAVKILFPMGYFFPFSGILAALITGLLFGGLAAIIPARQAARLEIVQALRYE